MRGGWGSPPQKGSPPPVDWGARPPPHVVWGGVGLSLGSWDGGGGVCVRFQKGYQNETFWSSVLKTGKCDPPALARVDRGSDVWGGGAPPPLWCGVVWGGGGLSLGSWDGGGGVCARFQKDIKMKPFGARR